MRGRDNSMRSYSIPALIGLATILGAQQAAAPNPRDVKLAGDRFQPLTYDQMTPPQKTMIDNLLAGERCGIGGPFNVLLRSPEIGDLAQKFGAPLISVMGYYQLVSMLLNVDRYPLGDGVLPQT